MKLDVYKGYNELINPNPPVGRSPIERLPMRTARWMIYGATGYTGRLIAQEAVSRGHHPVLAARNKLKLVQLADQLGLDHLVLSLAQPRVLAENLEHFQLVLNAAGPFAVTGRPVLEACLLTQTHYIDINGEIPFLEYVLNQNQAAQRREICVLPGAGFDVVPSDCLAVYVTGQLDDPLRLDIAVASSSTWSAGTRRSTLEIIAQGGQVRRDGRLMNYPLGLDGRHVRFSDHSRLVLPVPWGDLSTAYYSTRVPDITTYVALPPGMYHLLRVFGRIVPIILRWPRLRRWLQSMAGPSGTGSDPSVQGNVRSQVYARAINSNGQIAQAWLETLEAYQLTAISAVSSVEAILKKQPPGVFTPAQILGPDWVLKLEHTRRPDSLPERPSRPAAATRI